MSKTIDLYYWPTPNGWENYDPDGRIKHSL